MSILNQQDKLELQQKIYEKAQKMPKGGVTFKNYIDLCEYFKIDRQAGDSKKAQLKIVESCMKIVRYGNKLQVQEIYDTPKPIIDNTRIGNNSVYVDCIEFILLSHFTNTKIEELEKTKIKLFELLGMVGERYLENYTFGNRDYERLEKSKEFNITRFEIDKFYSISQNKMYDILKKSLNSLQKRCLILWFKETVLVSGIKRHVCSEDEESEIQGLKYLCLKEMGLKSLIQLSQYNFQEFYKKLDEKINKVFGYDTCYSQIKILYQKKRIEDYIKVYQLDLTDTKLQLKKKKELKELVRKGIEKAIKSDNNSNINKYKNFIEERDRYIKDGKFVPSEYAKEPFHYNDEHIPAQLALLELLI